VRDGPDLADVTLISLDNVGIHQTRCFLPLRTERALTQADPCCLPLPLDSAPLRITFHAVLFRGRDGISGYQLRLQQLDILA
jgi:hypothetical protein